LKTKKEKILHWFTGKSREKAELALELLVESEKLGYWLPKASRSVRAALGKHNVATKFARAQILAWGRGHYPKRGTFDGRSHDIFHAILIKPILRLIAAWGIESTRTNQLIGSHGSLRTIRSYFRPSGQF